MKKHFIKSIIAALVLSFVTLVAGSATVDAWGPERPTYTNESPAPYATFNSITNNAAIGDERDFVRVGEAGSTASYTNEIEVVPGKEYEVYIYYHNDAASSTNATGYGVATDVHASSAYPTELRAGERAEVSGTISWNYVNLSDQTFDTKVWDEAYFTTKAENVTLRYKTGTATLHNAGKLNGSVLSTALFTEKGTLLGFNKLSGTLPGCAEYSGYITYTLIAESTTSELTKEVSTDGKTWKNSITVDAGEYVTYKVTFKNTGNTTMTNVIFKDAHSDKLALRSGSIKVFDVNNASGKQIDDILDISGYNVGDVVPGALVQIIYQAKVANDYDDCSRTLANTISVEYNGEPQQKSTTNVAVKCVEKEDTPTDPCETDPTLRGCNAEEETPTEDPSDTPKEPEAPETPQNNPENGTERPSVIVNTGPVEIIMAIVIVLVVAAAGIYLWRTKRTLRTVEDSVSGKTPKQSDTKPKDD